MDRVDSTTILAHPPNLLIPLLTSSDRKFENDDENKNPGKRRGKNQLVVPLSISIEHTRLRDVKRLLYI
jgi:hypothetical protein